MLRVVGEGMFSSRSRHPSRESPGKIPSGGRSKPRVGRRRRRRTGWERGGFGAEERGRKSVSGSKPRRRRRTCWLRLSCLEKNLPHEGHWHWKAARKKGEEAKSVPETSDEKTQNSRFSFVWIDLTWRLRCSLLLKHLPHPGTLQRKIFLGLPVLVTPQSATKGEASALATSRQKRGTHSGSAPRWGWRLGHQRGSSRASTAASSPSTSSSACAQTLRRKGGPASSFQGRERPLEIPLCARGTAKT